MSDLLVRLKAAVARRRSLAIGLIVALVVLVAGWIVLGRAERPAANRAAFLDTSESEHRDEHDEHGDEVALEPEALASAAIETEAVTQRVAVASLSVTGTIEANQEQTQQVSSLVAGRVERVHAALGDFVRAGAPLAVLASPEVAELRGKLDEAETRLELARRNVERVKRAENRAAVLSAKARLDEADATLRRTRKLVDLGAGAGKDLIAAEAAQRTAKAEYDYQSNIALSREVQEAQAEVETAETEVRHFRQSLLAFGGGASTRDVAIVTLVAPVSGRVTERAVNAGAGVAAGQALFTIGDLGTVWVIANVPEAQIDRLRVGAPAEIVGAGPDAEPRRGRVTYVDPRLDETTRTARVRVEVANPDERLKVGMFVRVDLQAAGPGAGSPETRELVVASTAVQRVGERTVVFVPKAEESGSFEVRDVELGGEVAGYRRVLSGLELGEHVVTAGSFTLKTRLMKGELGEHGH